MPLPLSLKRAARRMEELIVATYVGHCLIDDEGDEHQQQAEARPDAGERCASWETTRSGRFFISHQKFAVDGWISLWRPYPQIPQTSPERSHSR